MSFIQLFIDLIKISIKETLCTQPEGKSFCVIHNRGFTPVKLFMLNEMTIKCLLVSYAQALS